MSVSRPPDPYDAAEAVLLAKRAQLVAEVAAVDGSLAAIAAARQASGYALPTSTQVGPAPRAAPAESPRAEPQPVSDAFKNLGLEQAAAKVLADSGKIEMTAKQIWAVLQGAGYSLLSDKPEQSVSWALRKREKKVVDDVILVGDGKWGMTEWYSQGRLKEIREARNNASTRNSFEHVEKTKAGIANARKTRIFKGWGRQRSITGDQMAKAYEAIQNGAKSRAAVAKAAGMSSPSFASYWATFEMENWRPGDPFPPARRAVPKKPTDFRIEDMWPRAALTASANVTPFPTARGSGGGSM